jgi:hypothetical protein
MPPGDVDPQLGPEAYPFARPEAYAAAILQGLQ